MSQLSRLVIREDTAEAFDFDISAAGSAWQLESIVLEYLGESER